MWRMFSLNIWYATLNDSKKYVSINIYDIKNRYWNKVTKKCKIGQIDLKFFDWYTYINIYVYIYWKVEIK